MSLSRVPRLPSRAMAWAAFLVVHALVAASGFLLPNQPMGDVYNVYEPWSTRALTGGGIVGIDESWVYPQLALVPMLLAHLFAGIGGYTLGWALMVTALDAAAFALLLGSGRSAGRLHAAGFWLAAQLCLGAVGMYRIDAVTVPLAITALLWVRRRPRVAAALLAVATWMKVWPAAVVAAAVVVLRARWQIIATAIGVSLAVAALVTLGGGAGHLFGFLGEQSMRGLQVEATVSTPFLLGALAGVPGYRVVYSELIVTYQVAGPGAEVLAALMTPIQVIVLLGILALGVRALRRGASFVTLAPTLVLALVAALIVGNKVGSPQFMAWLFAPLVFAIVLDRRRMRVPAALVLGIAALTQIVFPLAYNDIVAPQTAAVIVLVARNALLVALLVWAIVRLVRLVPAGARRMPPASVLR